MHQLTSARSYQLLIDMEDLDGVNCYAKYKNFSIDSEDNEYRLTLGGFEGDCGKLIEILYQS